jgi:hypothetical protein
MSHPLTRQCQVAATSLLVDETGRHDLGVAPREAALTQFDTPAVVPDTPATVK